MPVLIAMVACNSAPVFISQQERFLIFREALIYHHQVGNPPQNVAKTYMAEVGGCGEKHVIVLWS